MDFFKNVGPLSSMNFPPHVLYCNVHYTITVICVFTPYSTPARRRSRAAVCGIGLLSWEQSNILLLSPPLLLHPVQPHLLRSQPTGVKYRVWAVTTSHLHCMYYNYSSTEVHCTVILL